MSLAEMFGITLELCSDALSHLARNQGEMFFELVQRGIPNSFGLLGVSLQYVQKENMKNLLSDLGYFQASPFYRRGRVVKRFHFGDFLFITSEVISKFYFRSTAFIKFCILYATSSKTIFNVGATVSVHCNIKNFKANMLS